MALPNWVNYGAEHVGINVSRASNPRINNGKRYRKQVVFQQEMQSVFAFFLMESGKGKAFAATRIKGVS